MKILLIGEYSRLHNSLKEGLQVLGHQVVLFSAGDAFKKYPTDFSYRSKFFFDNWLLRKIRILLLIVFGLDLEKLERSVRFYFLLPKINDFDHVQLINSDAIETFPIVSRFLYQKVFTKIKSRSLLICGDETPVIEYLLKKELPYSILTPMFENPELKNQFEYPLKYTKTNYKKTFEWLTNNCQTLVCSDIDYLVPMHRMGYSIPLLPNPINCDKISFEAMTPNSPITIFLGINRGSYIKKGIPYFEKALAEIEKKYGPKVKITVCENQPYEEYIKLYQQAHIVLDQIYAMDQGYNALEAMAKGKVVFTGASEEFNQHYNLTERVAVNAIPDTLFLVNELSKLIENPQEIIAIGKRARIFIEKEHHYIKISEFFLQEWQK